MDIIQQGEPRVKGTQDRKQSGNETTNVAPSSFHDISKKLHSLVECEASLSAVEGRGELGAEDVQCRLRLDELQANVLVLRPNALHHTARLFLRIDDKNVLDL